MATRLAAQEISDLDPYKFMAVIGKRVIHPGGRASTQALLRRAQITEQGGALVMTKTCAKHGKFEWTMGSGVRRLRGDKKADYVLFILMRDSYSSGGRAAAAVGSV